VLLAIQAGPGSGTGWLRRWTRSCRPRRAGGGGGVVVAVPGAPHASSTVVRVAVCCEGRCAMARV
jgi:hypothetical protein